MLNWVYMNNLSIVSLPRSLSEIEKTSFCIHLCSLVLACKVYCDFSALFSFTFANTKVILIFRFESFSISSFLSHSVCASLWASQGTLTQRIKTHTNMDLLAKKKNEIWSFHLDKGNSLRHCGIQAERKQSLPCVDFLWHVGESQRSITGLRLSGHKQKDRKRHWGVIIHFKHSKDHESNKPHVKYVCFDMHWHPKS